MKPLCRLVLLFVSVVLSACGTLNSEFSCNLTAGDQCISMDEVNAMTEEKEAFENPKIPQKSRRVFLAPWKDSKGQTHHGSYAYLDSRTNFGRG